MLLEVSQLRGQRYNIFFKSPNFIKSYKSTTYLFGILFAAFEFRKNYHLYLLFSCLKTGMSQTDAKSKIQALTLMVSCPKMS